MAVYVVAQIRIRDASTYAAYTAGFLAVLHQYGGRLLAADNAPVVLEGEWSAEKINILAFDDEPAMRRWADSPEYLSISSDRQASTEGVVLLVHGVGATRG